VKIDVPFNKLPAKFKKTVLYGSNGEDIKFKYQNDKGRATRQSVHPYEGIIPNLERRFRETESNGVREELGKLLTSQPCKSCNGARLNEAARHVLVDGHNLPSIVSASIAESRALIEKLSLLGQLSGERRLGLPFA
jgi:excinuclease ABC subunit A